MDAPPPLPGTPTGPAAEPQAQPHGGTRFAGELVDRGKGRTFPCPACGAGLEFHIGAQALKCPFCGAEEAVRPPEGAAVRERDLAAMLARLRSRHDAGNHQYDDLREVTCGNCSGTVLFAGTVTGTECPYCATPLQLDAAVQAKDRIALDGLLPFQVDERKADANLTAWVESRWFAPNDFRRRGVTGKFNGVYLPYWTFDALTFTRYAGQRGDHYTVTVGSGKDRRTEVRTRWRSASGSFERFFDDTLVVASRAVRMKLADDLEPWPLPAVKPYAQQYLAGFLVRTYDVELEPGFEAARARMREQLVYDVKRRIGGDVQRITAMDVRHEAVTFKLLLLPVWMLAYRYGGEPHQVLVNAVTGRVTGERPYSWVKIALAVIAGLIVAGAVWFFTQGGGGRVR